MTLYSALDVFFNSFGVDAYTATDMEKHDFPYMTYEVPMSYLNEGEVSCVVNLWYKTESEAILNAKAKEIGDALGDNGIRIKFDDGYIWLKRGSPFAQAMTDESDKSIKRRYINITAEFLM